MTKLLNLFRKTGSIFGFLFLIIRFAKYRLYGANIFAQNFEVYGYKNIKTNGTLQLGLFQNGLVSKYDRGLLRVEGLFTCNGDVQIATGCRIVVGKNAEVIIGNSYINILSHLAIFHSLIIGDNCSISWNVEFLDEDFHKINYEGKRSKPNRIRDGNNVWIGSGVKILKGTVIPDGCIVAANSVVCSEFYEANTLIAGNPAKVIKAQVSWVK